MGLAFLFENVDKKRLIGQHHTLLPEVKEMFSAIITWLENKIEENTKGDHQIRSITNINTYLGMLK